MINERRDKRKTRARSGTWIAVLLIAAALGTGGWLYYGLYLVPPQLNSLLILVNGEPRQLIPGDKMAFHPKDRVRILKVSTSIPLNLHIRLVSSGFDAEALRYQEEVLFRLMPHQDMFQYCHFVVKIKYRNQDLGEFTMDIKPYVDDWLDKASRTIDKNQRLQVLQKACAMFPDDERLKKKLLEEYRAQGKWKKAAAMLEKTSGNTRDRNALLALLETYRAASNKKGMVSVLKRLVSLDPKDADLRFQLAETLEKQGKLKSAAKQYEAILNGIPPKEKLLICNKLGYLWAKVGQYRKAISFYKKASDLDPKDSNLFYNLSYLYEKTGGKKKARFYLEKALALSPGDLDGRMKLAQDLIDGKEWKKAKAVLTRVLKKRPKSLEALFLLAQVLDRRGEKKALIDVYRRILSINPKNQTVRYNLGILEYEAGNLKKALPSLEGYEKAHPGDTETRSILLDIYKRLKMVDKAYSEALALTKLGVKDLDLYLSVAEYMTDKGAYKSLIPVLEKGLKIHPDADALGDYLVVAYLKTGAEKMAMAEMERILKIRPRDVHLLMDLAKLREKYGDFSGALEAYKKVVDLAPDNEEAQNAYLRLRLKVMERE
ncbi:MAG: tetratricopeptide repeat protein [Deltaproteobacteria bacterium]|nr:tetratricopeptide repeat protein [Deltaproteobacteria bacterium]